MKPNNNIKSRILEDKILIFQTKLKEIIRKQNVQLERILKIQKIPLDNCNQNARSATIHQQER